MDWRELSLTHYSKEHLIQVYSQKPNHEDPYHKPNGLWVSVDGEDDWLSWCKVEQFALEYLTHPTRIRLHDDARILHIQTADGVRRLLDKIGGAPDIDLGNDTKPYRRNYAANWPALRGDYQGIIIAPYQWECRLEQSCNWYYTWDCASGCIWDAGAVAALEPLPISEIEMTN